jgi:hypothetical protein
MWNRGYCQSVLRFEQEVGFSSPQRGRLKIAQYFKCWDKSAVRFADFKNFLRDTPSVNRLGYSQTSASRGLMTTCCAKPYLSSSPVISHTDIKKRRPLLQDAAASL